jgi:Right handed beta helix region
LPPGAYWISKSITPSSRTQIIGAGQAITTIYTSGVSAGIFSATGILTDVRISDLTVDGRFGQGTYTTATKGIGIDSSSACTYRDLTIQNMLATGFACDHSTNGTIADNIRVFNCGAGNVNNSQGGGGAGIGIGTATSDGNEVSALSVTNCVTNGNGTYGIFFESQDAGNYGTGIRVDNCHASRNTIAGFCDAGMFAGVWSNCFAYNNAVGFLSNNGTQSSGRPGENTMFVNCTAYGNTSHGFAYAPTTASTVVRVSYKGCKAISNSGQGFRVSTLSGATFDQIEFDDCEAYLNQDSGLIASGPGTVKNLIINGGSYYNNGIGGSDTFGVRINSAATSVRIMNATMYDDQDKQTQTYGIALSSGFTITAIEIVNNRLTANKTGAISTGATLAGAAVFRGNSGYNPVGSSVPGAPFSLASSGSAWKNATGVDGTLYCTAAGTVTGVGVNGVAVSGRMAVGDAYRVPVGGTLTVTYSGAPTLVFVGD